MKKYLENGDACFDPKFQKINPYAAIHSSKTLSETEKLKLIIVKQEIEIERLKKGIK